jgi:hypothetical protein
MAAPPYQPHDITVVPAHDGGYLIGRVLAPKPLGPWWEYIETVHDLTAAVARARQLAQAHGTRAWVYDEYYSVIPSAESDVPGNGA